MLSTVESIKFMEARAWTFLLSQISVHSRGKHGTEVDSTILLLNKYAWYPILQLPVKIFRTEFSTHLLPFTQINESTNVQIQIDLLNCSNNKIATLMTPLAVNNLISHYIRPTAMIKSLQIFSAQARRALFRTILSSQNDINPKSILKMNESKRTKKM